MGLDQYIDVSASKRIGIIIFDSDGHSEPYYGSLDEFMYYRKNYPLQEFMENEYGYDGKWYAQDMPLTEHMIKEIMRQKPDITEDRKDEWKNLLKLVQEGYQVAYRADW